MVLEPAARPLAMRGGILATFDTFVTAGAPGLSASFPVRPASEAARGGILCSGWVHPGEAMVVKTGDIPLLIDKSVRALTCHGCGQVGVMAAEEVDSPGARRVGFYRYRMRNGTQVTACCRCQQIQPPLGTEAGIFATGSDSTSRCSPTIP